MSEGRFFINRSGFGLEGYAPRGELNGAQIRAVPSPSIGDDQHLWLITPQGQDDELISADRVVPITASTKFFTAPKSIGAGSSTEQIDATCSHDSCECRGTYIMTGHCYNCSWEGEVLNTQGHETRWNNKCPRCACFEVRCKDFVRSDPHTKGR